MSLFDYQESKTVSHASFDALIMAAMMKADMINMELLRGVFPEQYREVRERWNAPGGMLESEVDVNDTLTDDPGEAIRRIRGRYAE